MERKKGVIFLIVLIILLFGVNYSFLDKLLINFFDESQQVVIERVIDGDTIVFGNKSIRLLGINAPEKGELYYNEAGNFLRNLVLNKSVKLEFGKEKYDKYHRLLAYVFLNNKNVNLQMVENGFANPYFPSGKDEYYEEFYNAWESCVGFGKGLCEKSEDKCADCIELKKFDIKEQVVIFYNRCDFDCNLDSWKIKDEGRKEFIFEDFILKGNKKVEIIVGKGENSENKLYWKGEDYVWTETGDGIFLRDDEDKLVFWKNY